MTALHERPVAPLTAWALPPLPAGALVIGGDYQGLGIARALGRHGIPVAVLDDEHSIARYSRFVTRAIHTPDLRDEQRTVDAMLRAGRQYGLQGWVLFPTRDETVAAIARHRHVLSGMYRTPAPPWQTVQQAWDKRNTYALAAELGIPVPRTWQPQHIDELAEIIPALPVAIKPAIKEHFLYATRAKAWRADTPEELHDRYSQARALVGPGEVLVQELIPGDGRTQYAYCAFFKNGHALASMTARRRRQHPHEFGRASTYVETVAAPEVAALSLRFLRAVEYYGLVEIEYKRDPRDGRYKLLDVNARTWGYHSLGVSAGVNFPLLLYQDQLGLPVEPVHAAPGVRWVRMVTDVPSALLDITHRRLSLRAYLRSLARCNTESVFSRDDPLPGLAELAMVPYLAAKRGF